MSQKPPETTQPLLMKKTKSCNNNTMQIALHTAIEDWNKASNPQKEPTPPAIDDPATNAAKPSTPTTSSIVSDQVLASKITTIPYHSGNPTVYLVKGLIHLYKDR